MIDTNCALRIAEAIVRKTGIRHRGISEIVGYGAVNHVFVVVAAEGDFVVRFHRDPLDTDDYLKEEWCLKSMTAAGIPTPEFVSRGLQDGRTFIIQSFVEGQHGDDVRTPELWRTLGRYARTINEFPLDDTVPPSLFPRFGRDPLSNWGKHIAYNIDELTPTDPLLGFGVYGSSDRDKLAHLFEWLETRMDRFGITHGDIVPKNVLVTPSRQTVLLDWGSAFTGAYPYSDYGRVYFDAANEGFTPDDLACFCQGYGIPFDAVRDTLLANRVLDSIDVCRWALDHRPDRVAEYVARATVTVRTFKWPPINS